MGHAARANPLSARVQGDGDVIRPVVMPRTKQRVSPARMSPEGLDAWLKGRLTRDVVLTEAVIDQMVAKAKPGLQLAVRGWLETVLAEQRRKKHAAAAKTETFIARQTQFRGGVDETADVVDAPPAPEEPSTYDLLRTGERQDAERGGLLTTIARLTHDHSRTE